MSPYDGSLSYVYVYSTRFLFTEPANGLLHSPSGRIRVYLAWQGLQRG